MVGYKGTQSGLVTGSNYICIFSYPYNNGTRTESFIFTLTTGGAFEQGFVDWYWTNGASENWGTNSLTLSNKTTGNNPPAIPVLSSPSNGATGISLTPTLQTGGFSDSDPGDKHFQTEWEISGTSNFSTPVLVTISDRNLKSLTVPALTLKVGTQYWWRARFYDNKSRASAWSNVRSFTTSSTIVDSNGNGIPDSKENEDADLDNDTVDDIDQTNIIKTINTVGTAQMGASRRNSTTISAINSIDSLDPDAISTIARPNSMPFGLVTIDMSIVKPADNAEVTIYFGTNGTPQAAPAGASWYMYDSIKGWVDYSAKGLATFSGDRKSVTLKLKDWGHGDSDGLPNASIIDPGGVGLSGSIGVTVKDFNTNADIPNADITFKGSLPGEVYTYTAASDGTYATPLRSGSWTVVVSAPGYATQSVPVVMGEQGLVIKDIKLRPARILSPLMLLLE
jgi:hypothetical protein